MHFRLLGCSLRLFNPRMPRYGSTIATRRGEAVPIKQQKVSTIFFVRLAVLGFCLVAAPALSQTKKCTCDFANSKWEAYGTKAVCATFMHKGRTSCEVEFGGFGADPHLMSRLGLDPVSYQAERSVALGRYFQDLQKDDRNDLSDPKFLQTILPIIMRGAYLRPMNDTPIDQIKDLDATIVRFLDGKNASDVSNTFLAKSPPFTREFNGAKFEVGRGYMIVDHPVGRLTVVYFPAE